jgi:transcriptional antiterminator NusG
MIYVLQVMTGQEKELCGKLQRSGVDAICPQETRLIRRGGAWRKELRTIFPSYLFIKSENPLRIYYTARNQNGVLRWLGMHSGEPIPLEPLEETWLITLYGDGRALPVSTAVAGPDGALWFVDGPLNALPGRIASVDRHDRKAVVSMPLHGEEHFVKLSFTITQDTAEYAGAGSPSGENAADKDEESEPETTPRGKAYPQNPPKAQLVSRETDNTV